MAFWNKRQTENYEKIQKQVKENAELYKRVFAGKDGEAVLEDLRKRCFVDHTTLEENHGKMAFNEGRRSIFVHINNMVNKNVENILFDLKGGK